jgi:hypothetical protein
VTANHTRDASWTTDLIWHYLHETKLKAPPQGDWYTNMDPLGELSDRHRVYEIIVDEADQTLANTQQKVSNSKIPWNQNNFGFLKTVNQKYNCGSLVKIFFTRYMGWSGAEPKSLSIKQKGFDAAAWVIKRLEKKSPVRLALGGHHYVGIVGHRCLKTGPRGGACTGNNEFLVIEPWSMGTNVDTTMIYAGTETGFLQIATQEGDEWTYQSHSPSAVEGFE